MSNRISKTLLTNIHLVLLIFIFVWCAYETAALFRLSLLDSYSEWVSRHQIFYGAALCLGIFISLRKSNLIIAAAWAIILSFVLDTFNFFETLHTTFANKGFYLWLGYPNWANNPQFSILILYGFVLCILLIKLMIARFRSLILTFTLLLLFINLIVIYLNHLNFPGGIMKDLYTLQEKKIESLLTLDEGQFKDRCSQDGFACRFLNVSGKIKVINELNTKDPILQNYYQNISVQLNSKHFTKIVEHNKIPSIYVSGPNGKGGFYDIFSFETPKLFWTLNLSYFSRTCFLVSAGWFYFIVLLFFIHRKRSNIL